MRIGLVRHFKVKKDLPKKLLLTADEVVSWFEEYDKADIEVGEVDFDNLLWGRCYASDLPRAMGSAQRIYEGEIIQRKELREFEPDLTPGRKLKIPFAAWAIMARIRTMILPRVTVALKRQIATVLDEILSGGDEDTLIVSHGFVMIFLRKELIKRGFKGPHFTAPKNGKLYVFTKV